MSTSLKSAVAGRSKWARVTVLCACTIAISANARAQSTYTLLHKFYSAPRHPSGRLVQTPDGSLYGTTLCGGESAVGCSGGTVFALRPQSDGSWSFETLHHLRPGLHGANPSGGLTLARDGLLYGIARRSGRPITEMSTGTIFRVSPSAGTLTALHVFSGDDPLGRLTDASDGNLYGATCSGSFFTQSSIFRITPSGTLTKIKTLDLIDPNNPGVLAVNGFCPFTELKEGQDGFLYGTAITGGTPIPQLPGLPALGTVFRLDYRALGAPLTVLHTFRGLNGAWPIGGVTQVGSGEFFGTTLAGGLFGRGIVYRMDQAGAARTVHTFSGANGASPAGTLLRTTDDALYGATLQGGAGHGTVFRISAAGFSPVHTFTGTDGSMPHDVMQAQDGQVYGVTAAGGPGGGGTVFRLGPATSVTTLHAFAQGPASPEGGVIQASDGNFYGTSHGGRLGGGTVFKMSPSGELTVLHEFAPQPVPGPVPQSVFPRGLVEGADGFLYGRTLFGGAHNWGMIFRIALSGGLRVLHSFTTYNGAEVLTQGSDGNLYGASTGDSASAPFIFRVD